MKKPSKRGRQGRREPSLWLRSSRRRGALTSIRVGTNWYQGLHLSTSRRSQNRRVTFTSTFIRIVIAQGRLRRSFIAQSIWGMTSATGLHTQCISKINTAKSTSICWIPDLQVSQVRKASQSRNQRAYSSKFNWVKASGLGVCHRNGNSSSKVPLGKLTNTFQTFSAAMMTNRTGLRRSSSSRSRRVHASPQLARSWSKMTAPSPLPTWSVSSPAASTKPSASLKPKSRRPWYAASCGVTLAWESSPFPSSSSPSS